MKKKLISLVLIYAICVLGIVPHLNHELGNSLQPQSGSIVKKVDGRSGKRGRTYHFTIRLLDGELIVVSVDREEYHDYEIGDSYDLQVGTGFFGIEYAIDG